MTFSPNTERRQTTAPRQRTERPSHAPALIKGRRRLSQTVTGCTSQFHAARELSIWDPVWAEDSDCGLQGAGIVPDGVVGPLTWAALPDGSLMPSGWLNCGKIV